MMLDSPFRYDTYQHSVDHPSSVRQDGTSHSALSGIPDLNPHFLSPQLASVPLNLLDYEASKHSKVYS